MAINPISRIIIFIIENYTLIIDISKKLLQNYLFLNYKSFSNI